MSRRGNRNGNNQRIPDSVREFAARSWKKHKKENKDYFDGKKELKNDYFSTMLFDVPDVIDFVINKGHLQQPEIQQLKSGCYQKFAGEELSSQFIKFIVTEIKEGTEIPNIEFMPIILHEMIGDILKYNAERAEKPEEQLPAPDDLYELANTILKKRLKKASKKGLDMDMAFDLLCVMPTPEAIKYSAYFRVRGVFEMLYKYAATLPNIKFDDVVKFLFNSSDYSVIIGYALQERKEKCKSFNESQKKLFNDINEWIFSQLEEMDKEEIRDTLSNYIKVRKRDAAQGKDSNRRYYISSLPESLYPRIVKVVNKLKSEDSEAEKYL